MSWFKVDDQLHSHPKLRRAGLESVGLWVASGSFCMAYKTGGFVPAWFVDGWPKGKTLAGRLVASELWEVDVGPEDETGWCFHDWDHHQPTAEQIERQREKSRERQRRHRGKGDQS